MEKVIFTATATAVAIAPWVQTNTWQVGFYGTTEDRGDEK